MKWDATMSNTNLHCRPRKPLPWGIIKLKNQGAISPTVYDLGISQLASDTSAFPQILEAFILKLALKKTILEQPKDSLILTSMYFDLIQSGGLFSTNMWSDFPPTCMALWKTCRLCHPFARKSTRYNLAVAYKVHIFMCKLRWSLVQKDGSWVSTCLLAYMVREDRIFLNSKAKG